MNPMQALQFILDQGFQPSRTEIWLLLDLEIRRTNSLFISSLRLPTGAECRAVAGLDVVVVFEGDSISYGTLRSLCARLFAARPRRLQLCIRHQKMIYLKDAPKPC